MVDEDDARGAVPPGTWLERFANMVEERTDAPLGFAVGAAYAVASLLVPQDMYIQYGGPVHGQQFVCLVGDSGDTRKTVVVGYGRRVIKNWDSGLVLAEPDSEGGLAELMRDYPQALLPLPEMGAFLTGTQKRSYKAGLRSRLTALWDGEPFGRAKVEDPFEIEAPRLSVLAGVAPSFLEETLTPHDFDGGFLNRFLMVYAERERSYKIPPMLDRLDLTAEWAELRAAAIEWHPCVGWAGDGEEYWGTWMDYCAQKWGGNPRMRGFIARTAPLTLKAVLALAVMEEGKYALSGKAWKIDKPLLEHACWLGMLHLQSVEAILESLSMGPFSRLRREVLRIVHHNGEKGATMAQVLTSLAKTGEARKKRDVVEVLDTLVAEEKLDCLTRAGCSPSYVPYTEDPEV